MRFKTNNINTLKFQLKSVSYSRVIMKIDELSLFGSEGD